jgi:hypothetical protein
MVGPKDWLRLYSLGLLFAMAICWSALGRPASRKDSELYRAIETLLKGPEIPLPDGAITDTEGTSRAKIRFRWWLEPPSRSYREVALGYERETLLRRKLKPILRDFDVVVIDTPPAMRAATLNGLAVADTVLIPVDSSYFALLGLNQLLQVVAAVRDAHKPDMVIRALSTMYNRRQNLDKQIRKQVEGFFGPELVLETAIHKNIGIPEAAALHKAVVEYSPAASGSFDFMKLTQELIEESRHEQEATRQFVVQSE